eukprot:TRINITY_DN11492_c0_g1_i2.p1 TRINITY_DN11492_c0_g1~~TRINITY_DN11492_c0_g1_i2.p1  ORF type:complete len:743 (-),score=116.88 TRINITY_DN11492_c0_g1_i2:702-2930(-)
MNKQALCLIILCSHCLVSTSFDLTKNLKHYETIHKSQLSHNIVKRGATLSTHKYNQIREIDFKALGRDFRLILSPKKGLLSPSFKAVEIDDDENIVRVPVDRDSFYDGRVFGETKSRAQVHMEDGVITASIQTPDDIYHVEPAWRHLPDTDEETMIAYKESDIKLSWTQPDENQFIPPHACDFVKENGTVEVDEKEEQKRVKRSSEFNFNPGEGSLRQTRCPLLLVADYRFYKEMGGSNSKTTVNYLISLIDRVHKIYEDTVWRDTMDSGGFSGMGFIIKKIVVHRKPTTVREGEVHYNMFRSSWDVRNLLEVFSREYTHKDFCLAHLFTDIKFEGGILGLAYVGSPRRNSVGGICTPEYFKNGYTLYLNSGLSSSRNHYGQRVITREADLVTAHEFGHNWGSEHDPDIPECSPSASQGGSYLMYTYSVSGYDVNNKKFSPCSLRFIRKVLLAKSSRCFTEPEESFCGNLRVEGDEECDAGLLGSEDRDSCCDENCKLRDNSICSDKNSPCCHLCQYMAVNAKCRTANYATCEKEAECTGVSADCPKSAHMTDGTNCIEKGKCKVGKCIPFCETQGEQSCMCDSSADACKRCCRRNLNSSCNAVAPVDILPDGTPCFQGFCNKGHCEKTNQDIVRIWDFIDDISISTVLKFLKDNVVGAVIFISLLFWIPISCLVSWVDRRRNEEDAADWEWRRRDELIHPNDKRRIIHMRVPKRNTTEQVTPEHRPDLVHRNTAAHHHSAM